MEKIRFMWYVAYTSEGCRSPDPVLDNPDFDYISLKNFYNHDRVAEVPLFFSKEEAEAWIQDMGWPLEHDEHLTPTPIDLEVGDD